jgi:hypothetical protein
LTFNKWVSAHPELARENERLRRKVRILKAESRDDADAERLSDYVWY